MQNLIQLEDDVKGLPDQALQQLAQRPNPQLPQFLVVSEIQRRSDMRKRFEARQQQPQGTVAQQIVAPQQQGIGAMVPPGQQPMPQRMPMQPPMQQPMRPPMQPPMPPQGMAAGGIIRMAEGRITPATVGADSYKGTTRLAREANNLIGVRQYGFDWEGERGTVETDYGNFVNYDSPEFSLRTGDMTLANYGKPTTEPYGRGFNTLSQVINQYSPQQGSATVGGETVSYQNPTSNYLNFVSQKTGIDPNEEINLGDPATRANILSAIAAFESNTNISPAEVSEQLLVANQKIQQSKNPLRSLVPEVQLPEMNIPMPQQRETRVTTEEVFDAPVQQGGPQSLDELMTATFGDRQTPDVAPQSRQGAVSRLPELDGALPQTMRQPTGSEPGDVIRLAEDTKVDPKGLITTDNQPVGAIVEDALKAQPKDKVRPAATDISASLALLEQSAQAIGDPSTAVTERMRLLTTPQQVPAAQAASDTGDISILGGLITGKRKSPEEMARIQAERDATTKRMLEAQAASDEEKPKETRRARRLRQRGNNPTTVVEEQTGLSGRPEAARRAAERRAAEQSAAAETDVERGEIKEEIVNQQPVDDISQTAQTTQQQADQYIADARKARQEGLITKEDLAKKEALGAALIQLGAGIAKGDFAEGLSKAGVAAQDVREKARDRAVRSDYYEYLKTKPSTTGLTASGQNYQRLLKTVNTELEKEFGKVNINLMSEDLRLQYAARREQLLRELAPQFQLDDADIGSSLVDPVQAAVQQATPAGAYNIIEE